MLVYHNKLDFEKQLAIFSGNSSDINFEIVIPHIKKIIIRYLAKYDNSGHSNSFQKLLNPQLYDHCWIISHCHSILDYINLLHTPEFAICMKDDDQCLQEMTAKFIIDFKSFNTSLIRMRLIALYDPSKDNILTRLFMDRQAKSMGAFITAKLKTYYPNAPSPFMHEYEENITPFIIRHAIELKVKNEMLGIAQVFQINKKTNGKSPAIISISRYIDFLKSDPGALFELPPSIHLDAIQAINQWANNYIHTGEYEYVWVIKSVITVLEPMFSMKSEQDSSLNVQGLNYRSKNFEIAKLRDSLKKHLGDNYEFILYKD